MLKKTLAILLFLTIRCVKSSNNFRMQNRNVENCCKNLIRSIFANTSDLLLIASNDLDLIAEEIPHVTISPIRPFRKYNYVIQTKNYATLIESINKLQTKKFWNARLEPKRKFLIFVASDTKIQKAFNYLKQLFIINVIIIKVIDGSNFVMYKNKDICRKITYQKTYGDCNRIGVNRFLQPQYSLKGCTLRVIALPLILEKEFAGFQRNGTIGILIRPLLLGKYLFKLNINVTIPDNYTQEKYASPSGESTEITNGDLLIGSPYRHLNIMKNFEFSRTVSTGKGKWLVQKPKRHSSLNLLLEIYNYKVWLIRAVIFFLTITIDRLFDLIHNPVNYDITQSMIYYKQIDFASCVKKLPNYLTKRLFLAVYFLYSMHFATVFQTKLNSYITIPLYEKSINRAEDLLTYSYTPFFTNRTEIHYKSAPHSTAKEIVKRSKIISKTNRTLTDVQIVLSQEKNALYSSKIFTSLEERVLLHSFVDEIGYAFDFCYALPNASYFMLYVNTLIRLARESGFLVKWENDLNYFYKPVQNYAKTAVSFKHIQGAFICHYFGVVISLIVFFCELARFKFSSIGTKTDN